MKFFRRKTLSFLLVLLLVFVAMPTTALANDEQPVTVSDPQALADAIANIPEGGSGVINIEDMQTSLGSGLKIENKDVTFNIVRSSLQCGSGGPVISGVDANITINIDSYSSIMTMGNTSGRGVVRIENSNSTDENTFTLTVNGGQYMCYEGYPDSSPTAPVFVVAPGTKVELTDVACVGDVKKEDGTGEIVVNSGKFTNDVREYATDGKYSCKYGENYYVRDKEMTDDFSKVLTDGKIIFNYAKPSVVDESIWMIVEDFCYNDSNYNFYFTPDDFNDDFSKLKLRIYFNTGKEEIHDVDVVWNCDANVLQAAQPIIEKFLKKSEDGQVWFNVSDLELVNYWTYCDPDSEVDSLANYSGELKSYLSNTNFLFNIVPGAGEDAVLYTESLGMAKLIHDDKVYFATAELGARAEHVIYVPESTADTKEALVAAAQKKIDDYIGKDIVKITTTDETVTKYYSNDQLNEDGDLHFLKKAEGGFIFEVVIKGKTYKLVIIKDDTKLTVPSYATVDLNTKVSVTTDSSTVPLDTVIEVEKLTDGEDYKKIMEILDVEESETFDIKLHSGSLNNYFTKLNDGKFEVKIPVPEKFKGKNLTVYYVDQNNKPIEYEVSVTDGYATFATDHFSIYTLAEKESKQIEHTKHSGGSATCCTKATCLECKQPYGELNAANHSGGTEIKNAKAATANEKGYTGDTYCKGCGKIIANGKDIPATGNASAPLVEDKKDTPTTESKASPKTGDNSNPWLLMALALVTGSLLFATILWKRKEEAEEN